MLKINLASSKKNNIFRQILRSYISAFVTPLFLAISKIRMILPMPHKLQLFCDLSLKFTSFSNLEVGKSYSVNEKENGYTETEGENSHVSWRRAFFALNNLLSIMLTVIYILIVLTVGL